MESNSTNLTLDAGEGYFFERLSVEHSMLKSFLSGLKVSRSNFAQVGLAYESITQMEKKCRDQLEMLNGSAVTDPVAKLVAVNLCDDMLHSADREVAIVKAVMSRTLSLMLEVEEGLSRFKNTHESLINLEKKTDDQRIVDVLKDMNNTVAETHKELTMTRATYDDFMSKWSDRVNVRNKLFEDISLARKQLGQA